MIRVLIVDDSAFNRTTLARLLGAAPDIQVVGTARDGVDAIRRIGECRPDVVTLDLEMPHLDGLGVLRWLMAEQPLPVVVVTSRESNFGLFEALELGALDFVMKPGRVSPDLPAVADELVAKVRDVAESRPRLAPASRCSPLRPLRDLPAVPGGIRLMTLVASTGGPQALQRILTALPAAFPAAVAVVQHMPAAYTAAFADRLDRLCALPVREARHHDLLAAGQVIIAPGGRHMRLEGGVDGAWGVRLEDAGDGSCHVPCGDRLLESAARVAGPDCAGFVLTGMGDDGTQGLGALSRAGGFTVAESERSAVVFGMPRHAIAAGVVDRVLSLESMASLMVTLAGTPVGAVRGAPLERSVER